MNPPFFCAVVAPFTLQEQVVSSFVSVVFVMVVFVVLARCMVTQEAI